MNGRVVVLSHVSLPRLCFTTENLGDQTNGRPWVESEQKKACWNMFHDLQSAMPPFAPQQRIVGLMSLK